MKQNRRDGIDSGMAIMQPAAGTAYGRERLGGNLVDGPAAHSLRASFRRRQEDARCRREGRSVTE